MSNRKYTSEQISYIVSNIPGRSYKELTDMFNKQFGLTLKVSTMISTASRHGLRNGRNSRFNQGWEPTKFKKGHVPYNKGKKGVGGYPPTQFKKGNKPWDYKPLGTERVNGYGYIDIKIADPNKWRAKHILIWEANNGPVPKGYAVIFGDGDRRNFDLSNLLLVSRKELAVLNCKGLIQNSAELTKTGIVVANIYMKMRERSSNKKKKQYE